MLKERNWKEILMNEDKRTEIFETAFNYTKPIKYMMVRNVLLGLRSRIEKFNLEDMSKENLEDIFLEEFTNRDINYIQYCIKKNKWTLMELYKEIKARGCTVLQIVGCPSNKCFN